MRLKARSRQGILCRRVQSALARALLPQGLNGTECRAGPHRMRTFTPRSCPSVELASNFCSSAGLGSLPWACTPDQRTQMQGRAVPDAHVDAQVVPLCGAGLELLQLGQAAGQVALSQLHALHAAAAQQELQHRQRLQQQHTPTSGGRFWGGSFNDSSSDLHDWGVD